MSHLFHPNQVQLFQQKIFLNQTSGYDLEVEKAQFKHPFLLVVLHDGCIGLYHGEDCHYL